MTFDKLLYNDELLDALDDMRFSEPTPIQEKAIPVVEDGYDLIALAQTGTGKTAAYLLPVIDRLADGGFPEDAINCVIMAPTRELAQQIDRQMQGFAYFLPRISSAAIYGGTDGKTFEQQKQALVRGADVVIATPGRLIAHMQMGYVDLSRVSFFILDEADRMLDMGFFDDIIKIYSELPDDRQTLMFSATISPKIRKFAERLLVDPEEVRIALSKPPEAIRQQVYFVRDHQKEPLLYHILSTIPLDRIIVFSSSKLKVKQLARTLRGRGIKVGEMHSDRTQDEREATLRDFSSGRTNVLVATDIVARGIDITDISTVINFDVPHEPEDYVHRVGRTARAEATGQSITLVGQAERRRFDDIERLIGKKVERPDLPPELRDKAPRDRDDRSGKPRRDRPRREKGTAPARPAAKQDGQPDKPKGRRNNRHRPRQQKN